MKIKCNVCKEFFECEKEEIKKSGKFQVVTCKNEKCQRRIVIDEKENIDD